MAKIFISHSQKDKDIIHFLLEAFAGTNVKPHLEELEKEVPSGVTSQKISEDIESSNAVFVLLTQNVQELMHTRDWINWECGIASNKDIWIFEPLESTGKIQIVVPRFRQYFLLEKTDEVRKYLRDIIESYDDSHIIPTLAVAAASGTMVNEKDRATGFWAGLGIGAVGLYLKNYFKPSFGKTIKCSNCNTIFNIHRTGEFRCPLCNSNLNYIPAEIINK